MFGVGRKHTYGKAVCWLFKEEEEEGTSIVPDDILSVFIQMQAPSALSSFSLYKFKLLLAHHI